MPRGGKREGAGRPVHKLSRTLEPLRKVKAEEILASVDELQMWKELLEVDDYKIRIDALKYLTNRRDGMPAQSVALESRMALNLDSLPVPDEFSQPREANKPN